MKALHLPALMIRQETSIISAGIILDKNIYDFRMSAFSSDKKRVYPGISSLSLDGFDQFSLQLLYESNKTFAGSARIVKTVDGHLPFCTHFRTVKPRPGDLELSRFVTTPDRVSKKAFLYLLPTIGIALRQLPIKEERITIYADVLTGYPRTLNRNTYIEFGFESTGLQSFDYDYGLSSELFILPSDRIDIFMDSIIHYQNLIGRVRVDQSFTRQFVQNALLAHNAKQERNFLISRLREHKYA